MNQPQPPKILRVPGNFPTLRATNIFVDFDGGAFVLSVQELRPAEPYDAQGTAAVLASHEVGRFQLSPATLVWLKEQIARAEITYVTAMKTPLPDPQMMGDALKAAAALENLSKENHRSDRATVHKRYVETWSALATARCARWQIDALSRDRLHII